MASQRSGMSPGSWLAEKNGGDPMGDMRRGRRFKLTIDYSQSLEEMVRAGNYSYSDHGIHKTNFPIQGSGKSEIEVELIDYKERMTSDEVLTNFKRRGFRPAKIEELLAFGAKYPKEQRYYPIIALGSFCNSWLGPLISCLCEDNIFCDRRLYLDNFGGSWGAGCKFLAVRQATADGRQI